MPVKKTNKKAPLKHKAIQAKVQRRVKLAVVPHKENQHRPQLVRWGNIVAVLLFVVIAQFVYRAIIDTHILGVQADLTSASLLAETNNARAQEGAPPLVANEELSHAAQLKLDNMFAAQYWAHVAPDGTTPWHWFEQSGYRYAEAGENLAKNFSTSAGVVSAWMTSPTHRANVLKASYQDVGFAIRTGQLNGHETTIVVALYGTPESALVRGAADVEVPMTGVTLSPMAQFGIALKSLNPIAIASVVFLLLMANVAFIAHLYRKRLPLSFKRSWQRHHGLYKAIFLVVAATVIVAAYGGTGQI